MNERIRELALQAGIHFHKGGTLDAGPNGIAKFVLYSDMEKFAELIVRECAELSVNSRYTNTKSEYYEGFNEALIYVGNKIKQHFAVEE